MGLHVNMAKCELFEGIAIEGSSVHQFGTICTAQQVGCVTDFQVL